MADRIAAPIEAWALAVPDADDAVVLRVVERHRQLAAHHRSGGEFLVDAGSDDDGQVGHGAVGALQLLGERADRRTLVAGGEGRSRQPEPAVDAQLVDREAGDRLDPGEEHGALLHPEAIGELVAVPHLDVGHERPFVDQSPCCTPIEKGGRGARPLAAVDMAR